MARLTIPWLGGPDDYHVEVEHGNWSVERYSGNEIVTTEYNLDFLRRIRTSLGHAMKRIDREITEQEAREAASG